MRLKNKNIKKTIVFSTVFMMPGGLILLGLWQTVGFLKKKIKKQTFYGIIK